MSKKEAFDHVQKVLGELSADPAHAEEHVKELDEAIAHMRAEKLDIPPGLNELADRLAHSPRVGEETDDDGDAPFDNMPV